MTPACKLHRRRQLQQAAWAALWLLAPAAKAVARTAPAGAKGPTEAATDAPPEVRAAFSTPDLQGQGHLRFMGLRVYEALLWTVAGQNVSAADWARQPLALEIRYQRALKGTQIAERSLQEMKRQGDVDEPSAQRWLQAMKTLFPDVVEGSRITGLLLPQTGLRIYVDGRLKGSVDEVEFARRFIGIWLAPQSSDQRLRTALLGPTGDPGRTPGVP